MSTITNADLRLLLDHAISIYQRTPPGRLVHESRDMTDGERRMLAYLQASIMCLIRTGTLDEASVLRLQSLDLRVFIQTASHDIVDADMEALIPTK